MFPQKANRVVRESATTSRGRDYRNELFGTGCPTTDGDEDFERGVVTFEGDGTLIKA